MTNSYDIIEYKFKSFTKKFYINKIIKGLILTLTVFLSFGLLLLILEYFLYFNKFQKIFLVLLFSTTNIISVVILVFLPFLKYLGILKTLNKKSINDLIVDHFPEIKDRLWNIIELQNNSSSDIFSEELIIASIDQKIEEVKSFKFTDAIDFKKNLKFLYFLLASFILILFISFFSPSLVKNSTHRLRNYNVEFERPSPYSIIIKNDSLSIGKGDDFKLIVYVTSKKEFENFYISFNNNNFLMNSDSLGFYSFNFSNLNNDVTFKFVIDDYNSINYNLVVLDKPGIKSFKINIFKPNYTLLENEVYDNLTEVVVPVGTNIKFSINTYNTESIFINGYSDIVQNVKQIDDGIFEFSLDFKKDSYFTIGLKNDNFSIDNFLSFNIKTIQDDFPSISVVGLADSIDLSKMFFKGFINDDYGFSTLNFVTSVEGQDKEIQIINIEKNQLQQNFYYSFDFSKYKNSSNRIDYYFEIFDNDQINGFKSAVSDLFSFTFPDSKDVLDFQDEKFQDIEQLLSQSSNLNSQLQKEILDLKEKLINSQLTNWEKKSILSDINNKKQLLEKSLGEIRDKNEELNNYLKSFTQQDEQILEKQKQIQEMLEQVFSDDLKKMLDEFNKMMQDLSKKNPNNENDKLEISLDDLSKQLDKNIELLKKMQIEQKLDLLSQQLKEMSDINNKISDDVEKGVKLDSLVQKEKQLEKNFKNFTDQYSDIQKLNDELENPINLLDLKNESDQIKQEFQNSLSNMEKGNKKKSQESLKKNSEKMNNLSFMFQQMIDEAFKEQQTENLSDLMQILDNLVTFSFAQEKVILPVFRNEFSSLIFGQQKKLSSDFKVIEDSLYSLSKREPSVNMVINKEIVNIKSNFKGIDNSFTLNNFSQIPINQQNILTSSNNLALFLSEIIKNMQEQMANSQPGNQNCQKPGGKNPKPSNSASSQNMQKSLQQQLEKIMKMMKDGKQGSSLNNEMGKAISQQEKMHQMLQEMMNQGQVGSSAYETLKKADQLLNQVREDILRNNVTNSTIERQKQILTRLLEADKAENERDLDDKRKSNTATNQFISETAKFFENQNTNNNFEEKLLKNKLILNNYYQKKYQNFIYQLDSINGEIHRNRINGK